MPDQEHLILVLARDAEEITRDISVFFAPTRDFIEPGADLASSVSSSASTTRRRPTACWTPRGNGSPTRAFTVFAGRPIRR